MKYRIVNRQGGNFTKGSTTFFLLVARCLQKKPRISRWRFHFFYFHPYLGKIPMLTNICQRGWNHQLALIFPQTSANTSCTVLEVPRKPTALELPNHFPRFRWVFLIPTLDASEIPQGQPSVWNEISTNTFSPSTGWVKVQKSPTVTNRLVLKLKPYEKKWDRTLEHERHVTYKKTT